MKRPSAFRSALALSLPVLLAACAPQAAYTNVSVHDLHEARQRGAYVLDVRTPAEYAQAHVEGARLLPLQELFTRVNEVPDDQPVYVICRSGNRSAQASRILADAGRRNVFNVEGGMLAWEAARLPTTR